MSKGQPSTPLRDAAPAGGNKYAALIEEAKNRGKTRPQELEGTPRFGDNEPWRGKEEEERAKAAPKTLSSATQAGLEAVARANAEEKKDEGVAPAADPVPEVDPYFGESPEERASRQLREKIEKRCAPLDIGQYLMGGELIQEVPIVPEKLVVKFRTASDLEEVFVDAALANEKDMTQRQFLRRTNEFALATHVYAMNGEKWPALFDADGTVSAKSVDLRMARVRKLPGPIFHLLMQNLGWFSERVNAAITMEALGNG